MGDFHSKIKRDIYPDSLRTLESYRPYEHNVIGCIKFELIQYIGHIFEKRLNKANCYLHFGCGSNIIDGWVNADVHSKQSIISSIIPFQKDSIYRVDGRLDGNRYLKINNNSVKGIFTEHVLEHIGARHVLNLLCEFHRVLIPEGRIRICLPDCKQYVEYYTGAILEKELQEEFKKTWATGPEAIRGLTQYIGHISTWDAELLGRYLEMAGFLDIKECSFGEGNDANLVKDTPDRRLRSFYMEAKK